MSNNIEGKVIIITGASSGIGETTAKHLASSGALLSLGARRKDHLDRIVKEIKDSGGEAVALVTDVTQRQQVKDLVKFTVETFGRIDVMINNAGVMPLSRIEELQFDEWDKMIDTNIKGVLYGIGAVLPYMIEQKSGHIINIASVAGHRVPLGSGSAVYSATKFAVRALSEGLRQEVTPYNIRTTIISPGAIKTELPNCVTDQNIKYAMKGILDIAISADSIARAIAYAIEQPEDFDVNEILLRPTAQTSWRNHPVNHIFLSSAFEPPKWDGEFVNTVGAKVKVKNEAKVFYSVFINHKTEKKAIVVANPSYDQPISVEVELGNKRGGFLMASPEVPETKKNNGKIEIPALSAVVLMEK